MKVSVKRRFVPIGSEQWRDPDFFDPDLFTYFEDHYFGVKTWDDLLGLSPVVVVGEGRIGKTFEFKAQVERLKSQNQFAFFIPLERLHDEGFEDALDCAVDLFRDWKRTTDSVGYFFLDALDELKLRNGTLRRAIKKYGKAIEPHYGRVNTLISCRPADWKNTIDSESLSAFCVPASERHELAVADSEFEGEAVLRALISGNQTADHQEESKETTTSVIDRSEITIVSLLPLSQTEIRKFATEYSPDHADGFCKHIESNDLWNLHRLPEEIIDTLNQMRQGYALGSLEEQVKLKISKKLQENAENKPGSLSLDKALIGSERIALALYLLKRRSIQTERTNVVDTLDINDVLSDWQDKEKAELIGKGLFDSSGIGLVRFHHRTSQEYLAAKRLQRLRDEGMPQQQIFDLLFSVIGDTKVLKPSMAPVAAWLALWMPDVCGEVISIEPHSLLRQGLPSALSLDLKSRILRSYVNLYASK